MEYEGMGREILSACKWLAKCGFIIGTWGNVSIRCGEHFLLTPSRVPYDVMTPRDMVLIDMEGNKVAGRHNPSSEKEVHRMLYLARPDIGAVVHCHSVCATAVSAAGVDIPPFVEEISQLVGEEIRTTGRYVRAGEHHELGMEAARYIGNSNAVLLKNHGPVCCGKDIDEALLCCQVVEKAAHMFLMLEGALYAKSIPKEAVQAENYRYHNTYGKEA